MRMAGVWRCVLAVVVLMCVYLWGSTEAVGGAKSRPRPQRRPSKKPKADPIELTPPLQNIDINQVKYDSGSGWLAFKRLMGNRSRMKAIKLYQMMGTWYLLNTASKCSYLIKHGTKVEPTVMTLTHSTEYDQALSVSTKTRHSHQCWEILQIYNLSPTSGRLTLKGSRPELNTEIVISDTDYNSYAIMTYQKRDKITMKLYVRSVDNLSEEVLSKFEQVAEKQNLGLAYLFPFPTYSHCGTVDEDHIIKCIPAC